MTTYTFPFGQPVIKLEQQDISPKKVFVLGVYASAVHAKWKDNDGKTISPALAVASEPCIFWRGDEEIEHENAEQIISRIDTKGAGTLSPSDDRFNGPSGKALDELFLKPLELKREDAWLCDIVPYSCRNPGQKKVIKDKYVPMMKEFILPEATTPELEHDLFSKERQKKILDELSKSKAETIILLGDKPIEYFQEFFKGGQKTLRDFGQTPETYGKEHKVEIAGKEYIVLPLVHPRQASALGAHSPIWLDLHTEWVKQKMVKVA